MTDQIDACFDMAVKYAPFYSRRHSGAKIEDFTRKTREALEEVVASLTTEEPKGVLLIGPLGSGKAHALHAIIREIARLKLSALESRLAELGSRLPITDKEYTLGPARGGDNIAKFNIEQVIMPLFSYYSNFQLNIALRMGAEKDNPYAESPYKNGFLFLFDLGRGYNGRLDLSLQRELFDYRWRMKLPVFVSVEPHLLRLYESPKNGPGLSEWPDAVFHRLTDPSCMVQVGLEERK